MQSTDLVSSFAEIAREKDIDRDTLQLIVEDVIRAMVRKRYGADDAFEIILNPDHGDVQVIHIREVVEDYDMEDPVSQIELRDAVEIDEDFEIGDEVANTVDITEFGRRAVMTARQTFRQKIRDIEKENIYYEYSELIGEIVVGEVYQTRRREVLVIHNKVELVLPRGEQIPRDRYRKGDMLRAIVKDVKRDAGSRPQVIISRSEPIFMARLFELEVPEIEEGVVEIKKIVREPGDRAKVAVVSHDERIDPVGACVGLKGNRIHAIVRELSNENIDVMLWSDDDHQLIKRALSPANPISVSINEELEPPRAKVIVKADEVSQAIGRGGINIRLASRMAGYEIDVYREIPADEEDIEIVEFGDEFSEETIQRLRDIGCDTAKAVLELSVDELVRRSGLDRDVAKKLIHAIKVEFDQEEAREEEEEAPDEPDVILTTLPEEGTGASVLTGAAFPQLDDEAEADPADEADVAAVSETNGAEDDASEPAIATEPSDEDALADTEETDATEADEPTTDEDEDPVPEQAAASAAVESLDAAPSDSESAEEEKTA
ncbi:MAG: transcription termination/antitermination protein NusA [Bacteroidetes bacterium]|jgi:N utilization substance protein A|nr:transcription termination/antitermination protein NusA [Bacteroidota bacterium]